MWISLKPTTLLTASVVLCFVVRIAALILLSNTLAFERTGVVHGNEAHDTYTVNLLKTGVFGRAPGVADAAFPPLYVFFLAPIYAIFGRGYFPVGVAQTILDAIAVVLIYHIGKRLFRSEADPQRGEWVGALAGLFYALYPYIVFQNLTLVETGLFLLLLHAFLLTMILLRERERWDRGTVALVIISGVILGLALHTRPIIAPLLPFIAVWFLFRLTPNPMLARLVPVGLIGVALTVPWILRNYQVFGSLVLISTNSGENFWMGNNEQTIPFIRTGYHPSFASPGNALDGLNKVQANAKLMQMGFDYLREHPEKIPELAWVKFAAFWSPDVFPSKNATSDNPVAGYQGSARITIGPNGEVRLEGVPEGDPLTAYSTPLFDQIGRTVHRFYFGGLLVLGVIGMVLARGQWRTVSLLWLTLLCMTLVYVVFNPSTRYRVPTDPLLFMFSAYTLLVVFSALWARRGRAVQTQRAQIG